MRPGTGEQRGLMLVEIVAVIAIIAILAGFAVPKFLVSVERAKAAEAFKYLSAVRAAQERHHVQHGSYAATRAELKGGLPVLEHFETAGFDELDEHTRKCEWSLTLTRKDGPSGFGDYTIVYTQLGFDAAGSSISSYKDLRPEHLSER